MKRLCVAWVAAVFAWPVAAADAIDAGAERARIASERAQLHAAFARREHECRTRFAVTDCIDAARREHRDAMSRLRRQESVLDESERRRRAAERMEAIRAKLGAEAARAPAGGASSAATAARESKLRVVAPREPPAAEAAASSPQTPASGAEATMPANEPPRAAPIAPRRPDEAARRAAFEQRAKAAATHREAVTQRQAQRAASGKPAASSLPPGPGASAP